MAAADSSAGPPKHRAQAQRLFALAQVQAQGGVGKGELGAERQGPLHVVVGETLVVGKKLLKHGPHVRRAQWHDGGKKPNANGGQGVHLEALVGVARQEVVRDAAAVDSDRDAGQVFGQVAVVDAVGVDRQAAVPLHEPRHVRRRGRVEAVDGKKQAHVAVAHGVAKGRFGGRNALFRHGKLGVVCVGALAHVEQRQRAVHVVPSACVGGDGAHKAAEDACYVTDAGCGRSMFGGDVCGGERGAEVAGGAFPRGKLALLRHGLVAGDKSGQVAKLRMQNGACVLELVELQRAERQRRLGKQAACHERRHIQPETGVRVGQGRVVHDGVDKSIVWFRVVAVDPAHDKLGPRLFRRKRAGVERLQERLEQVVVAGHAGVDVLRHGVDKGGVVVQEARKRDMRALGVGHGGPVLSHVAGHNP